MDTATWIAISLLAPFWWSAGLLLSAVIGDLSGRAPRARVSRFFDRLQRTQEEPVIPHAFAA